VTLTVRIPAKEFLHFPTTVTQTIDPGMLTIRTRCHTVELLQANGFLISGLSYQSETR